MLNKIEALTRLKALIEDYETFMCNALHRMAERGEIDNNIELVAELWKDAFTTDLRPLARDYKVKYDHVCTGVWYNSSDKQVRVANIERTIARLKALAARKEVYLNLAHLYTEAAQQPTARAAQLFVEGKIAEKEGLGFVSIFLCHRIPAYQREELALFEPSREELAELVTGHTGGGWWAIDSVEGYADRAMALYFAAEMCE